MTPAIGSRSGILLLDKPPGITSHDVVARVRRLAGTRKVGHAGTLDPMATGLLVLGLNSSTRLLTYLVGLDKEYLATIRLGQSSSTDDAMGELGEAHDVSHIDPAAIERGIAELTGDILQRPSAVSAIKVAGRRAYDRVRDGETVELDARPVTVSAFELLETRRDGFIDLDVRVECSSGTYIRALARDLGEALGVGGHLTALRRSRVGPFMVSDAATLPERPAPGSQPAAADTAALAEALLRPADVAASLFGSLQLTAEQARDLAQGKRVEVDAADIECIAAVTPDGALAGLVELRGRRARPLVNFPTDEVLA
ncbi:tRNA pseudouridine(55) synthase TruB [Ruicaihuangia caeni]|uniref:tRNA pseudouridine synthase B n=1 Tax=Ruicaihuangia caeni TaxID=3042517 RepID=A0AAW6T8P9_9MICO|nr:tRNA pseudouridine(55) synthase TruB [Klugiella sp. YN-L-19]MDI2097517.1 tRNA pseudouridine(55) synthase TruB [Klugiella sp. YN-L-19]